MQRQDGAIVRVRSKVVLKKFEGEIPPEHQDDPEAHGHKLLETVIVEDGEETRVIPEERV